VAVTYRTSSAGGGTSGTGNRTITVTPAVGDLLFVFVKWSGNAATNPTCTDNNGSGTYNLILTALNNASADIMAVFVRTATMANTTSTVITPVVGSGTNTAGEIVVVHVANSLLAGSAAVRASGKQENQTSGVPTPALGSAAYTTSLTMIAIGSTTTAGAVPNASWTERQDASQSSPVTALEVATRDSGFTGTSAAAVSVASAVWSSAIIEVYGNVTSSQTNTGVAKITATTTRTQTGKAKVTATTTRTQTGVAKISATSTRTQDGRARITATTPRTQDGRARITATTPRTQPGTARIQQTVFGNVQFDAKTTTGANAATGATIAHTTGNFLDRTMFVVLAMVDTGTGGDLSTIDYDSVSMVEVGSPQGAGASLLHVYRLIAPSIGNHNLVMTFSGTMNYVVMIATYYGVDQSSPFGPIVTAAASSAFATLTVPDTVAGNKILDALVVDVPTGTAPVATAQGSQVERMNGSAGTVGFRVLGASSDLPAGGNAVMAWSLSASREWAQKSFEILASMGRTQRGKSRITATATRTQSGVANIVGNITTTRTQSGTARITATTPRTQTGVAKVTATTTRTQTGVAKISATSSRTQDGKSRITATTPRTQTGAARITATTPRTQTGKAKVTATTTRTQTGVAKIAIVNFGNENTASGQGTSITLAHNPAGTDRVLLVAVAWCDLASGNPAITAATFNGTGMTQLGTTQFAGETGLAVFAMVAPPTGSHNVFINWGGPTCNYTIRAATYVGANQIVPIQTSTLVQASGTGTAIDSTVLGTFVNSMVFDAIAVDEVSSSVTAASHGSQIERLNIDTGAAGFKMLGAVSDDRGGSDEAMTWTLSGSKAWVQTAFEILVIGAPTTQIQTGKARITATTSRTQAGTARVTVTTPRTQAGKARITATTPRTQAGTARVTVTTPRTQAGTARVTATTPRTQPGKASLVKTAAQTQQGVARVTATTPRTQTGVAKVTATTTRTQTGVANILLQGTASRPQTGVARITATATRTQAGTARIGLTTPRTQSGTARVTATTARTQQGAARVTATTPRAQTGKASLVKTASQTQPGVARVQVTSTRTQTGKARITGGAVSPVPVMRGTVVLDQRAQGQLTVDTLKSGTQVKSTGKRAGTVPFKGG